MDARYESRGTAMNSRLLCSPPAKIMKSNLVVRARRHRDRPGEGEQNCSERFKFSLEMRRPEGSDSLNGR